MTKKSNSVLGGRPLTLTSITSTGPRGLIVTLAAALGRQPDATTFAARSIVNSSFFSCAFIPVELTRRVAMTTLVPIDRNRFMFSLLPTPEHWSNIDCGFTSTGVTGMKHFAPIALAIVLALLGAACGQTSTKGEAYAPGLGELMTLQQMRHTKLWLAGQAGNWDLAAYELDELGEGFDDIVKFHPTHKDSPVAPKDAIPRMIAQPVADAREAVNRKDAARF